MLKIVLDTNILISAFLTPDGESYFVFEKTRSGTLFISPYILAEVEEVLNYPRIRKRFKFTDTDIQKYITELYTAGTLVQPHAIPSVCTDPDDNFILACASEVSADYLVTRNLKDFPQVYSGTRIISPRTFLQMSTS